MVHGGTLYRFLFEVLIGWNIIWKLAWSIERVGHCIDVWSNTVLKIQTWYFGFPVPHSDMSTERVGHYMDAYLKYWYIAQVGHYISANWSFWLWDTVYPCPRTKVWVFSVVSRESNPRLHHPEFCGFYHAVSLARVTGTNGSVSYWNSWSEASLEIRYSKWLRVGGSIRSLRRIRTKPRWDYTGV